MYKVQPQFKYAENFEAPKSMYFVKSLTLDQRQPHNQTIMPQESSVLSNEDLNQLEHRQERLFKQLEQLALKLKAIKESLIATTSSTTHLVIDKKPKDASIIKYTQGSITPHLEQNDVTLELVITMSPNHSPLALIIIQGWLTHRFGLSVSLAWHVHSTVNGTDVTRLELLKKALAKSTNCERSHCHLCLRIIWKPVGDDLKFVVSSIAQSIVTGEVNLLRYLASAFEPSLRFEDDQIRATDVDNWLDLTHLSFTHGNNKERQAVLRLINAHLGKNKYLVGGQASIADVAMLCALVNASVEDLPTNVRSWMKLLAVDGDVASALEVNQKQSCP